MPEQPARECIPLSTQRTLTHIHVERHYCAFLQMIHFCETINNAFHPRRGSYPSSAFAAARRCCVRKLQLQSHGETDSNRVRRGNRGLDQLAEREKKLRSRRSVKKSLLVFKLLSSIFCKFSFPRMFVHSLAIN